MSTIDWIRGDSLALDFPTHIGSLKEGGETFLTRAFIASGILDPSNEISAITECLEVKGGSTGRKCLLSVEYAKPSSALHRQLFVKFSRDFDDDIRDMARVQMELEVLFALLSRSPSFPISVPVCYFADFHHESGTGILITQRIPYDQNGTEPHYPKCKDYLVPDQLGHYRCLIRALGRLAGSHKAGIIADDIDRYFPFHPDKLVVSKKNPYTPEQISERVAGYADFARSFPQLLPENIRSETFLKRFADEAPRFQSLQAEGQQLLKSNLDMIALCHWNAHIDNAWFWRNAEGELESGLMDWGNVSQMNVAMAIWGCLSGAELFIWNDHLDELLELFISEFKQCGGSDISLEELKLHLMVYVGAMGLNWMLDSPSLTLLKIPNLSSCSGPRDTIIQDNERARSQLLIMSASLNLWAQTDFDQVIDQLKKVSF